MAKKITNSGITLLALPTPEASITDRDQLRQPYHHECVGRSSLTFVSFFIQKGNHFVPTTPELI